MELHREPTCARVRGSMIAARLAFADRRWGHGFRDELVGVLSEQARRQVDAVAFEGGWFDVAELECLEDAILVRHGGNRLFAFEEMGRFSAEFNAARLAPQFTGLRPLDVCARIARLSPQFQDFGETTWGELETKGGLYGVWIAYRYPATVAPGYCASAGGFLARLFEILGFAGVRLVETACSETGGAVHRFEIRWTWPDIGRARRASVAARPVRDRRHAPSVRLIAAGAVVLAALVFAAGALGGETDAAEAPTVPAVVQTYACDGPVALRAECDEAFLVLESPLALADVRIVAFVGGTRYVAKVPTLAAGVPLEIALEELRPVSGETVWPDRAPAYIEVAYRAGRTNGMSVCRER